MSRDLLPLETRGSGQRRIDGTEVVLTEALDASTFQVSPVLIRHQVENHGLAVLE